MKIAEILGTEKDREKMMNINNNSITENQIACLACCFDEHEMKHSLHGFAVNYMGVSWQTVGNLQYENLDNPKAVCSSLIRYWTRKNLGSEQVMVI